MRRTDTSNDAVAFKSFHEKAGECQVFSFILSLFFFLLLLCFFFQIVPKPPLSPPFHPHSLLSESLGARWVYLIQ